jgi:type II secretory pathway pseudopilin PulG
MQQAHKERGQAGYVLLSVMLLVAVMLLALSIELPRIAQQIKREKEEELQHRGLDYAMAIKRFFHKTGRYPTSLEQLEDTNHVRFLRKRYKDPMTPDGEWRLVHPGEAQINFTAMATNPGLQGGNNLGQGGGNNLGQGGGNNLGQGGGNNLGQGGGNNLGQGGGNNLGQGGGNNLGQGGGNSLGQGGGNNLGQGGGNRGQGQLGSLTIQNIGNGQPTGGGFIIGVASTSKSTSIKEPNGQTTYDGWLFVYEPRLEQSGATGIVVAAPTGNAPPTSPGASSTPTPAPTPL